MALKLKLKKSEKGEIFFERGCRFDLKVGRRKSMESTIVVEKRGKFVGNLYIV